MAQAAVDLARQLRVDSKVHFNYDWVPYAERARFLLDADLGVSRTSTRSRRASRFARGCSTISGCTFPRW